MHLRANLGEERDGNTRTSDSARLTDGEASPQSFQLPATMCGTSTNTGGVESCFQM